MKRSRRVINRAPQSTIAGNAAWMMVAHGGRVVIQGLYFVFLARTLGVSGFGAFTGALAFVSILAPFAGWGMGSVLIMSVARDRRTFAVSWGNALITVWVSAIILAAIAVTISGALLPATVSRTLVVSLAVSEFLFGRLVDISGQAFQAAERLSLTALLNVALNGLRLLGLFIYSTVEHTPSPASWSLWYAIASGAVGLVGVTLVGRLLGRPRPKITLIPSAIKQGFFFSFGIACQSIYSDIDKTMLMNYSTAASAGTFGAAYRVINMAFLPVQALLAACYSRFFQAGATGIRGALSLMRRLLPLSAAYGAFAALTLYLLAPVVPLILGKEYASSVAALRWLALVPFLQSLHFLFADTLTASGFQRMRSAIQAGVALFNVLVNLWLIPRYSWMGAAWSTLLSEGLLAIALCGAVMINRRRESTESSELAL